ncbi:MAG: ectoine synthase [Nitrococcus mobilis]|nr:ectoine synthase [Nitrococcus mobilis]
MIYRTLDELIGSENDVRAPTFHSRRLLLKSDGMGFSFHDTILFAGSETYIWYANHLEAVYCIEGEGELETVDDGKIHPIHPGVFYALDKHDKHYLRAKSQLRMMCVFNPPLTGREVHDAQGTYPLME